MFSEWISSQLVLCHEHHSSYNCWLPLGIFRLQKCCYRSSIHPENVKKKKESDTQSCGKRLWRFMFHSSLLSFHSVFLFLLVTVKFTAPSCETHLDEDVGLSCVHISYTFSIVWNAWHRQRDVLETVPEFLTGLCEFFGTWRIALHWISLVKSGHLAS